MVSWISNLPHWVCVIWHGLGGETKGALVGATATLFAAFAGFGAVIWQIRSQGRQARAAILETERRKLKAGLYEDAVSVCRSVADSAIELSTQLRTMAMHIEVASRAEAVGLGFNVPTTRFQSLTSYYAAFSDAALRFIFLIENRRIVDPRIIVFRTAMSTVLHDTRDLMYSKFVIHVMPALPIEGADGALYPYQPPAIESAVAIKDLADRFIAALDNAIMYTEDFIVEMQNKLLGDLFQTEIAHRLPIDAAKRVVRLDQADELESWFRRETSWGKECDRVESETRARFSGQDSEPPPIC